jgi:triosephosphate isomerase (TIM)
MAKPILVANWKNRPDSIESAEALTKNLAKRSSLYKKLLFSIAPPLPYFEMVTKRSRSFAKLSSQDISLVSKGAHTGEVGSEILKSFGVKFAIVGHSERRLAGESNEVVSEKVRVALRAGISPILCVGELARDDEGGHLEFLRDQIKSSLEGVKRAEATRLILAYEPVWAIGKEAKDALGPRDLSESIMFVKKTLTDIFGRPIANKIPILYGGSVEPANAESLYHESNIRGFLVGHASLHSKDLSSIAEGML